MITPAWTVLYNIVSKENSKWIGTGWEFFDEESEASKCYKRHLNSNNTPIKRKYHKNDKVHLGAVHRM